MSPAVARGKLSAGIAVTLAVGAGLWLALWPCFYTGVEQSAVVDGVQGKITRGLCASLVEVNGPQVLSLITVPIIVAAVALMAAHLRRPRLLWGMAVLMLVFSVVGAFSVGPYYLPTVVALSVAAARAR